MTTATITLTPQKAGISQAGGTLDVLIRVQAPAAPSETTTKQRPALHLALVLDRSGSMEGQPLTEAKRCAQLIVERLTERDQVAVVVFDNRVQTLVPLQQAGNPERFQSAIGGIESGGNTALHGGWLQGAQELATQSEREGTLSRVVLLSDGQANAGITDIPTICTQCKEMAGAGISTTTIGLGRSFNEELMVGMAKAGQGQNYFSQSAEDLYRDFVQEQDFLEALHSRQLSATLVPGAGVIVEVLSQEEIRADAPIPLSDLAYGAETWFLVRLHHGAKAEGSHALLSVSVSGKGMDGTSFTIAPSLLELQALEASTWSALPEEELVVSRRAESLSARLLLSLRRRLGRGDRAGAERALAELRELGAEHGWIADSVVEMERLLEQDVALASKEALYKSRKMQTRLAAPSESSYTGTEDDKLDVPTFLRRR
jgi:Ca-activated chloride channel family protein